MGNAKRIIAIAGIALTGGIFSLMSTTQASAAVEPAGASAAATWHGPYSDLATCNYWMYGVRAGGTPTTNCFRWESGGWYFIGP